MIVKPTHKIKKRYRVQGHLHCDSVVSRNNVTVCECYSRRMANRICELLNEDYERITRK